MMPSKLNIVLYEPEIPQNTGNIARLCACCGASLYLVGKLGFSLSSKYTKRAGLDYWQYLTVNTYKNWEEFKSKNQGEFYYCSTKGQKAHSEVEYPLEKELYFVFGKESYGLPEPLLKENYDRCIRIPMKGFVRSLNLSNAVAVVVGLVDSKFEQAVGVLLFGCPA